MHESKSVQRLIGVYVEPDEKEWVKAQAEARQWTPSFFCRELIREAMAREEVMNDSAA